MKRSFIVIVLPALLLTGFSIVFADNHGSGSGKLDIFSPTGASQDTLPGNTTLPVTNSLPEKYWAYDADADDRISAEELRVAVNDFQQQESPYSEGELTAFIDYYFNFWMQ